MLPSDLARTLQPHLNGPVRGCEPVGGGCIANACRLAAGASHYFLKWAHGQTGETFPAEAYGLGLLRAASSPLIVPEVLASAVPTEEGPGFLLMEWIDSGIAGEDFWDEFGRGLAALHRYTSPSYGAERDNFIGRLPQRNERKDSWTEFFRTCRLEPQVEWARERRHWRPEWNAALNRLLSRLGDILPATPEASTLHGDLWSGNFIVTSSGRAALIDPAAYYGLREADLAMTELFGGFPARFYDAYDDAWPLEPGYPERREVYNLYHMINHLNHFGNSYAGSVAAILERYR